MISTAIERIKVSDKGQITIPIKFFLALNIGQEADCYLQDNAIVIRPSKSESGEFDEQILADLINQGFSGNELLDKFKEMRRKIRPAIERMLSEATDATLDNAAYASYSDVFGEE